MAPLYAKVTENVHCGSSTRARKTAQTTQTCREKKNNTKVVEKIAVEVTRTRALTQYLLHATLLGGETATGVTDNAVKHLLVFWSHSFPLFGRCD